LESVLSAGWAPLSVFRGRQQDGRAVDARAVASALSIHPKEPTAAARRINAKYAQGYPLFMRDRTLMAQRFNPDRLELIGEALPIARTRSRRDDWPDEPGVGAACSPTRRNQGPRIFAPSSSGSIEAAR
jgi:hypothetical protein